MTDSNLIAVADVYSTKLLQFVACALLNQALVAGQQQETIEKNSAIGFSHT